MTVAELDEYFRSVLNIEQFTADSSLNGVQVENDGSDITKVAFAVDACAETIQRASQAEAGMLFVHHGIFWGHEQSVTGIMYRRLKLLFENNMALYACHVPLDANEAVGNNYGLARRLKLMQVEPFGVWRGMSVGVCGILEKPCTLDCVLQNLFPAGEKPLVVLPFGRKNIKRIVVVSGSGSRDIQAAAAISADVLITGDFPHEDYHLAEEIGMNVIAGGHYQTETVGVSVLAAKLAAEKQIETLFIDVPTGL